MRLLDYSFEDPAHNLALDEALLNQAETGHADETLRFWESPTPFVVLGLTQTAQEEAHLETCESDEVPILRRCSAGGCVLQQAGCLNFSLILDQQRDPSLTGINASYRSILGRVTDALSTLGVDSTLSGTSDLSVDGRKFSGNAQRRRKRFILHHGTLLYQADFALCTRYLKEPTKRPEYRATRKHQDFLLNLPCEPDLLKLAVSNVFHAKKESTLPSKDEAMTTLSLASEKYRDDAWNRRK